MTDELFGKLDYDEFIGWNGTASIEFGGHIYDLQLIIRVEEDEYDVITKAQKQAFKTFHDKWRSIEPLLVDALIDYYNQEEKFSYGPDNEEEAALWWPDINTYEELVNAVTPESIMVPPDYLMEKGRKIFLLFGKKWGGEDLDDNGIGVCFINEQISEIGYKDIAF